MRCRLHSFGIIIKATDSWVWRQPKSQFLAVITKSLSRNAWVSHAVVSNSASLLRLRTAPERESLDRRLSAFNNDNERLNPAFDRTSPKSPADSFSRDVGSRAEPRLVARLDLVAQRRPLAVSDCRNPGRRCSTAYRHRTDTDLKKSSESRGACNGPRLHA